MQMQQAYWIVATIVALAILGLVLSRVSNPYGGEALASLELKTEENCQLIGQGCVAVQEEKVLRLQLLEAASPLDPFTLQLFSSQPVANPVLSFAMQGMDMGNHRYRMLPNEEGGWFAQVILPVCTTGRMDWLITVSADSQGKRWQADFPLMLEKNQQ